MTKLRAATVLPFSSLSDEEIAASLKENKIGLTVGEAKKITELLGRDPTLTEAVIWGIQGSEHCSYKSSRRFLKNFLVDGKHIILGPKEDSGIVAITDEPKGKRWGLVVTHESHNKPSQIVPYEGAATGVGGTVRDVVCMGARVIGAMDMLRLGDLKTEETRTIAKEVMRGIAGYGNPLGVPNLGGDTVFDSSYNRQCLVNAVAIGIVREDEVMHSYVPDEAGDVGYDIILVGKPTDRSGFGGASFASATLKDEDKEKNTGAVQEPNPFLERHILASTYALFDWLVAEGVYDQVSCKDLGAGGVVCASVEQVADKGFGADIRLENVHVAIEGLPPEVIACAETQERLCFCCHPDLTQRILKHFNETWDLPSVAENAGASVIGKVTNGGIYHVTYNGETICKAKAEAITCGLQYVRPTAWTEPNGSEPDISCTHDTVSVRSTDDRAGTWKIAEILKTMLVHPNHASKSPALLHYDKDVIGNTVIEAGEGDASVIAPLQDLQSYVHQGTHPGWELPDALEKTGVALAADGNARYGKIDPYWQGANAAVESMRNVVACGATPRALTDCLNYGNPELPQELACLERGVLGIADAGKNILFDGEGVPVISGNVSLYNGGIPPTAVVACIGVIGTAEHAVDMRFKQTDSDILFIGKRSDECGGSAYYQILEELLGAEKDSLLGTRVPKPNFAEAAKEMRAVIAAIATGHVLSCHDISDGGLLLALFEMTLPQRKIGGTIGATVRLEAFGSDLRTDTLLFSETGGYLLEVSKSHVATVEKAAKAEGATVHVLGETVRQPTLGVMRDGAEILSEPLSTLHTLWENGLVSQLSETH